LYDLRWCTTYDSYGKLRRRYMNPSYYLIWVEKEPSRKYSQKFPTLEGLNDFLQALRADNIESVEVVAGYCLEKR